MLHKDELRWSAVQDSLRALLACLCFAALRCSLFLSSMWCTLFTWQLPLHCFFLSALSLFLMMCSIELVVLYCCSHSFRALWWRCVCGLVLVMVVLFTSLRRAGSFQRQVGTFCPRTLFRALSYLSMIFFTCFHGSETLGVPGGMFKIFPVGDVSIIGRILLNLASLHEGWIGNDCR